MRCGREREETSSGRDLAVSYTRFKLSLITSEITRTVSSKVARITSDVLWPKIFNRNVIKSFELSLVFRK